MQKLNIIAASLLLTCFVVLYSREDTEGKVRPLEIGNFALPSTQWPGPLFSFGQDIAFQNAELAFVYVFDEKNCDENFLIILPAFFYALRDDLSLLIGLPIEKNRVGTCHSAGIGDLSIQLEYAYYVTSSKTDINYATVLAIVGLPTGSNKKVPPTGFGSTSLFFGLTFGHMDIDWYAFMSPGAQLTTTRHGIKFGDSLFYEFGIGHNICHLKHSILLALLEVSGIYSGRTRINRVQDCNTGGNRLYVGPSLFFSRTTFTLQAGFQMPITQHLFGRQAAKFARFGFDFTYTF